MDWVEEQDNNPVIKKLKLKLSHKIRRVIFQLEQDCCGKVGKIFQSSVIQ